MVYRRLDRSEFDDISSRILWEDNYIIIFNKRVGEIVQGDKTGDEPLSETLKAFIAQRDKKPGKVFLGVPHRLDRPVSGVTLFAKRTKSLERLNEAFREGEIDKRYWALVGKKPDPEAGELKHFVVRREKQNKSFAYDQSRPGAKEARLRYELVKATDRYFLLEIELMTGRHHQIRCQLAAIGSPIKGDLKYGAPRSNKDGGISLHARSISFTHPVHNTPVYAEATPDWVEIR